MGIALLPGRWTIRASRIVGARPDFVVVLRAEGPDGSESLFHGRTRPRQLVSPSAVSPRWWATFAHAAAVRLEHVLRHDLVDFLPTYGTPTIMVPFPTPRSGHLGGLAPDAERVVHTFEVASSWAPPAAEVRSAG